MRRVLFKTMVCFGLGGALLAGCQTEDLYNPDLVIEEYEDAWEEVFGQIDPEQTWNVATRVTADIALPVGKADVSVYTSNPIGTDARLVAETTVERNGTVAFDIPQSASDVFVVAKADGKVLVNGYFPIEGEKVVVGKTETKTAGEWNAPATVGTPYTVKFPNDKIETFYPLENVETVESNPWKVGDFRPILGKGGVFEEGQHNDTKWIESGELEADVVYEMLNASEVTLTYNYRCTGGNYPFGYFYYTGDASDMSQVRKYILIDNPVANNLVQYANAKSNYDGTLTIEAYKNLGASDNVLADWSHNETLIKGTIYKLVYYGEDGNGDPTYTFPAGVKIAFFQLINNNNEWTNDMHYSLSSLNKEGKPYAATFRYGETVFLGFEDWTDGDLNDIMFFATGDFKKPEDINPNPTPEPEPQSWILACEDLGSTDDFDFNDIVFSVSHVGGSTEAIITPLAAGGTLAAEMMYGGDSLGEIHSLLGVPTTSFANTQGGITQKAEPFTITVPEDFSLTEGMGGFSLRVTGKEGGTSTTITAPGMGEAPQMICVPGDWQWPTERTNISLAYPEFGEWGANYGSNNTWYNNPVDGKVVKR